MSGLSINTNVPSLIAQNALSRTQDAMDTSMRRLATGYRINSASDGAAELQRASRMTSQVNGLYVAINNANDAISITATAEGGMSESTNILQQIRDLALQSTNDSNDSTDRASIDQEIQQLKAELDRIAATTTFGGQMLIDGSFTGKSFQVGANADEVIGVSISSVSTDNMGMKGAVLDTGNFQLNGMADHADQNLLFTVDGVETKVPIKKEDSAEAVAQKVTSMVPELSARAKTDVNMTFTLTGTPNGGAVKVTINGKDAANVTGKTTINDIVLEIEKQLTANGYNAKANNSKLTLIDGNGKNLDLKVTSTLTAASPGTVTLKAEAQVVPYEGTGTIGSKVDVADSTKLPAVAHGDVQYIAENNSATYTFNADGDLKKPNPVTGTPTSDEIKLTVATIDVTTYEGAQRAIPILDRAISDVDTERAMLGALQNRFQHTIFNLQSIRENMLASRGRMMDTDYAAEVAELTKREIQREAAISNLRKANEMKAAVLRLLA